jgi:hypothetical protein
MFLHIELLIASTCTSNTNMAGTRNSDGNHADDIKRGEILCAGNKCHVVRSVSEGLQSTTGARETISLESFRNYNKI